MRLFFALTIALMLLAAVPASAQQLPVQEAGQEPVSLEAESITHSAAADTYTATGNIVVTRGNQSFTADIAEYDRANNVLTAFGAVVVKAGDDILTGERIRFELDGQTGEVVNGAIFLRANELTIKGALIQKTGPDTFGLERGSITACPGEKPDWRITASKVRVKVEGYGTARNATLWLRDIPVFYLPWFAFPAKTKRTTGLLVPEAGQSSRKGFSFNQPLFLAPQQHWDITLYSHYMEKRGHQAAAEFRHTADENSRIHLLGAFLQDRKIDDGLFDNSIKYGYASDAWLRENQDRYWLAGKLDRDFENGVKLRADIDIVSDQD
ncbi:MAG: putative LPS assembly protein LptD, partial [Desulfatibacillaceae bacterium]|nr:putative LPS assembly protein LptD [Desulfatibacillaceae bacterium]